MSWGRVVINTLLIITIAVLIIFTVITVRSDKNAVAAIEFLVQPSQAGYADISGAVNAPGLYAITLNTRVADLIKMAGGLTSDADTAVIAKDINLSKKVVDQDKIYLPRITIEQDL